MNLKDLKNELLQDPRFRKKYYRNDPRLDIALMIEEARIIRGITQKDLAERMHTKQSAISRAESGYYLPSLSFLEKMAKALGTELSAPKFAFLEEKQSIAVDNSMTYNTPVVEAVINILGCRNHSSAFDANKLL
jgi:transcriptional regulator with XRE-family HTH domain